MKMYFAGIASNVKRLDYLKDFGASKLMLTYADSKRYNKQLPRFREKGFEILFDSGAFSMWRRGIEISVKSYCDYLKKNTIENYIVLDQIGNHSQTMLNQRIMEDAGLTPIPVFHLNSPIENLYEISEKYSYICLGGTVGSSRSVRMEFFNSVFEHFPAGKFHALGLTDIEVVKSFPFYSVDSTTWLIAEKVGKIFTEKGTRCNAPLGMSAREKFENTISFFVKLEQSESPM